MHALIIEDECLIALVIEGYLRELGYISFAFAASEEEAVASAAQRCPDLITSDVMLDAGNGIDAVLTICPDRRIPVVFITGSAEQVVSRNAAATVVQKPFGMRDLHAGVQIAREAAHLPGFA
jgi:CheY-like chemotaxis protein